MKRPTLTKRINYSPNLGDTTSFSRTFTEGDVSLFIGATWDVNPLHTDDSYISQTPFKRRIVPGLLTASLLTHLGGLWAFLGSEMHFTFIAPVFIGDTITAEATIAEIDPVKHWVRLDCRCINQNGDTVLTAIVTGFPGQFED